MFRFIRAGGIAAAAIALVAGAAFADPTQASEAEAIPVIAPYTDHAVAAIDGGAIAAEAIEALPAAQADFSTPVPGHAVATLADEPIATPGKRPLRDMVSAYSSQATVDDEQECLAGAVYFESKGEPLEGQLAVAEVIINRSRSGRFPRSLCGVVKQKSQFSFVRGGRIPAVPKGSEAWRKAVAIAHIAQQDLADSSVSKALFFHATYVRPGWRNLTRMASVGNHIFYR